MTWFRSVFAPDMSLLRPLASRIPRSATLDLSAALAIHGSGANSHTAGTTRPAFDLAPASSIDKLGSAIFLARVMTSKNPADRSTLDVRRDARRDVEEARTDERSRRDPRRGARSTQRRSEIRGPRSAEHFGVGVSEEAQQQERSRDGGATSGSEASRRTAGRKH